MENNLFALFFGLEDSSSEPRPAIPIVGVTTPGIAVVGETMRAPVRSPSSSTSWFLVGVVDVSSSWTVDLLMLVVARLPIDGVRDGGTDLLVERPMRLELNVKS